MMNEVAETPSARWGPRIVLVMLIAVVLPIVSGVLYRYSPTEHTFLPCLFHLATGLHCPGCGATRCVHALLHLDFAQALAYNPLFVIALPLFVYSGFCTAYTMWTGRRVRGWDMPRWAIYTVIAIVFAFWLLRNIDVYPFTLLAPHPL